MKLKFENQQFQLQAVRSVIELFNGLEIPDKNSESFINSNEILNFDVVANNLMLEHNVLLQNLQNIQLENGIEEYATELYYGKYDYKIDIVKNVEIKTLVNIPNFTIEMETGTGKTYAYIRTIFELNKKYGLSKFIIVVPSDAIRIGTLKSLEMTNEHFKAEYNNIAYDYYEYDSAKINKVRDFATNNTVQIMVMTIAAFNSSNKVIYQNIDKFGEHRPIDLIKASKPIVIIDEPQSVDNTDTAQNAIKELNPLVILRYSATHRELYNPIYKLDAVDAYNQKLVKQIEVESIQDDNVALSATTYIKVIEITSKLELALELDVKDSKGKTTRKTLKKIAKGTDLQEKTNNDIYSGYIIEDYSRDYGLKLANLDYEIAIGEQIGNEANKILKTETMIRLAIENHIKKELRLAKNNIKVLSLFFIEHVRDYRDNLDGVIQDGYLVDIFKQELKSVLATTDGQKYIELCKNNFGIDLNLDSDISKLHNGYFAVDKKGNYKDLKADKDTADAVDAYGLIMRDKEKLLDSLEPLRFIFSHSALKEGWDNPNVFQVCVLQDSSNTFKRRQQIGRGLRLCVNANGDRIRDDKVNVLTVIAGESYNVFAANLQQEYEKDANIKFGYVSHNVFVRNLLSADLSLDNTQAVKLSEKIHNDLVLSDYVDANTNKITDKGRSALKAKLLELSDSEILEHKELVYSVLNKLISKLPIKNQKNKVELSLNKKVYLSEEFKLLWKKISAKTIFYCSLPIGNFKSTF